MERSPVTRREFLKTVVAGSALAEFLFPAAQATVFSSPNERFGIACIGLGGQGRGLARRARNFGDIVALCDVDQQHLEQANQEVAGGKAALYRDYRRLLERNDVDVVIIATPDHWHTKICIEAMQAGKDVYCEKPLTLTIEEGKLLCRAVRETKRVLQVGTQQRSEYNGRFLLAVALVRQGRLGKVKRVTCAIGGAPAGGPFPKSTPPPHLDWDMWLGQAPKVDYIKERCHYTFRWWYEYSGGKITDWGAHHVDIAQWAIGMEDSGPTLVEPLSVQHPVPLRNGYPTVDDCYNTATAFLVRCLFPNGVELFIRHDTPNGIRFEGEEGELFVSRGALQGPAVEELKEKPLPEEILTALRKGKGTNSHMGNFFECVRDRSLPISDVFSHHRALTTCHLANIALRLGRPLKWDPGREQILDDPEANAWQSREQRKGYEIRL